MVDEKNHSQNLTYNSLEWFQNFQEQHQGKTIYIYIYNYIYIYRFEWFSLFLRVFFAYFGGFLNMFPSTTPINIPSLGSHIIPLGPSALEKKYDPNAPEWTPPTYTGYTTLSRSSQYHSRLSVYAEFTPCLWTDGVPLMIGTVTIMAGLFSTEHQRWIGMLEPHSWSFSIKNLEEGGLQICT